MRELWPERGNTAGEGFHFIVFLAAAVTEQVEALHSGNIDPYVLVQYKGQERKSSIARGQGNNPVWDEKFTFRAEYPGGDEEYKLILKVMDHDNFSSDDYLGEAIIYLKEFLQLGVENGKAEIHPSKYSIVGGDQTFAGEIKVGLTFTRKEGQNEREEFGGWKESGY